MSLKHLFTTSFIKIFGKPRIKRMQDKQKSLSSLPKIIHPTENSPTRFEIPSEAMKLVEDRPDVKIKHLFPIRRLLSIINNIHLSVDSISKNPNQPSPKASTKFLEKMREYEMALGVGLLEFVRLPHDLIFQKYGVLYDNAIILAMEMSKDLIDKAPSQATLDMVFGTYDDLGIAANKLASFLREQGYAAQADHPLGGLVLFPPLAQKAGIGWVGKHGLLITPEFGSRVRLAAVYTNIENLPFTESNDHRWIEEYCMKCGLCEKQCPPKAIWAKPITQETGQVTHISQRECFEYFVQYYGCSICIKVCPFSQSTSSYNSLKSFIEEKN